MIRPTLSALFGRRSARASAASAAPLLIAALVAVLLMQRTGSGAEGALSGPATATEPPLDTSAPRGLSVAVKREGKDQVRVSLRRPGHMVTLSCGDQRDVGRESASIRLPYAGGSSAPELAWETADWSSLSVARGALRLVTDAWGALGGVSSLVDTPAPVASLEGRLHRCVAYADGAGGFTALCRVGPASRQVGAADLTSNKPKVELAPWRIGAANLTSGDPRQGVWLVHGDASSGLGDALVRLDVPLLLGSVEGRLVGYLEGATSVVIRAEASRLPGEEPRIVLSTASQKQPVVSFPPIPKSRLKPREIDFF
jgi:hypothetical protein